MLISRKDPRTCDMHCHGDWVNCLSGAMVLIGLCHLVHHRRTQSSYGRHLQVSSSPQTVPARVAWFLQEMPALLIPLLLLLSPHRDASVGKNLLLGTFCVHYFQRGPGSVKRRRRGQRAGSLVRLRRPDPALELDGFQLYRVDRDTELSGKSKGGGICFYVNRGWCIDVTVILQHCSNNLETLLINCKPFYSPREQRAGSAARTRGADSECGARQPGLPYYIVIVLGDFNKYGDAEGKSFANDISCCFNLEAKTKSGMHWFPMRRTLVYSLLTRGKPVPLRVMVTAALFCSVNGFLQGHYLLHCAHFDHQWSADCRCKIGFLLFFVGMAINVHSDWILRRLRLPGDLVYKIPTGGLFDYVSAANYFGEIVEWFGFAVATWSVPGLSFAVFTLSFLGPRAYYHHRFYLEKFKDYPKSRKALLPFLF